MEIAVIQLPRLVEWIKYCEFASCRDLDQEVAGRMYSSCGPALNDIETLLERQGAEELREQAKLLQATLKGRLN